jgi:hypothetical protein
MTQRTQIFSIVFSADRLGQHADFLHSKIVSIMSFTVIASEAKQSQKYYPHNNYEIASDYRPRNDDKI